MVAKADFQGRFIYILIQWFPSVKPGMRFLGKSPFECFASTWDFPTKKTGRNLGFVAKVQGCLNQLYFKKKTVFTLPETNLSTPLKNGHPFLGNDRIPTIHFQGENAVSFREGKWAILLMEEILHHVNNGINYLSTGAGFQPSTVSPPLFYHQCSDAHQCSAYPSTAGLSFTTITEVYRRGTWTLQEKVKPPTQKGSFKASRLISWYGKYGICYHPLFFSINLSKLE